jgi:hypothetical protein
VSPKTLALNAEPETHGAHTPTPLSLSHTHTHTHSCPEDVWLSGRQWEELQERLPGVQATFVPGVRHAYCASGDQCAIVTELMQPVLTEALAHHRQWAADVAAHRLPAERTWMKGGCWYGRGARQPQGRAWERRRTRPPTHDPDTRARAPCVPL